jgi:hypothetical protein
MNGCAFISDFGPSGSIPSTRCTHMEILVERLNGREPPPFWSNFAEIDGQHEQRFPAA